MKATDTYYFDKVEPNKSCLLALRAIILKQNDFITEDKKWGIPCFSYKNKMFCFLSIDAKSNMPYLLFVEGKHLNYPGLKFGNRSRMKSFSIDPNKDLPLKSVHLIINLALELYTNGTIIIKKS